MLKANKSVVLYHAAFQTLLLLFRLALPIVLGYFIDWFGDKESVPLMYDRDMDGYLWAGIYTFLTLCYGFFPASYFHTTMVQGNTMRLQVCTILYKKVLKLNSEGASR